jgi:hypothetical protein
MDPKIFRKGIVEVGRGMLKFGFQELAAMKVV